MRSHKMLTEPKPEDRLVPISQVSAYLSISRSKVYQLMNSGKIPHVKLGKSLRIRWSDMLRLVSQNLSRGED